MRFLLVIAVLAYANVGHAADKFITLASTTSTQNSGLYDYLLPIFSAKTGIQVRVIAVGTGQAIKIAQNGDADVLIVHHRASEERFIADGFGIMRRDLMYNDFVVVGPSSDPAEISSAANVSRAFSNINETQSIFISRGDESGTHKKEQNLWANADIVPSGTWYREIGSGMGAALNMASAVSAYTLSDRGTWLSFGNKGELGLLFAGDETLFNPYSVIVVNPNIHPHVKLDWALQFSDWLISEEGQAAIGAFKVSDMQLFCPNPTGPDATVITCPSVNPTVQ